MTTDAEINETIALAMGWRVEPYHDPMSDSDSVGLFEPGASEPCLLASHADRLFTPAVGPDCERQRVWFTHDGNAMLALIEWANDHMHEVILECECNKDGHDRTAYFDSEETCNDDYFSWPHRGYAKNLPRAVALAAFHAIKSMK